jgi:hypothetical protein
MCYPCLRTPVNHLPGPYSPRQGDHPRGSPVERGPRAGPLKCRWGQQLPNDDNSGKASLLAQDHITSSHITYPNRRVLDEKDFDGHCSRFGGLFRLRQ